MANILNSQASINSLIQSIREGNQNILARCISLVENEAQGYQNLLLSLPANCVTKNIIGITGPPGAGKSTLIDALIDYLAKGQNKIAIICVDPSSPFHFGALLGDRIRMNKWFGNPNVFIRSLASRGNLGGLNPKVIEIMDLVKAANFEYIIVETVGVGQSEVEIAGIADTTIVVLTPESGDDIQTMKAGLMEIADIFVVNKCDHPEADNLVRNLLLTVARNSKNTPVLKTIASQNEGIEELANLITGGLLREENDDKKHKLLAEKAFQLIQMRRMKNVDKVELFKMIQGQSSSADFNLYKFVETYQ
jgi:LAO/AO transport system kinase